MKEKQLKDGELYEEKFHFKERRQTSLFILLCAFVVLFFIGARAYWDSVFSGVLVSGPSMERTLQNGDKLLVKSTGWWNQPDYGDVIIVWVADYEEWKPRGEQRIIKRLIAKEGDSVYAKDGTVYLKKAGESAYTALYEPYAYYSSDKLFYDFSVYTVGAGEIFFLGDNRFGSQDSRYQENASQLDYLYKASDIIGTVPEWAIANKTILEKIFFGE